MTTLWIIIAGISIWLIHAGFQNFRCVRYCQKTPMQPGWMVLIAAFGILKLLCGIGLALAVIFLPAIQGIDTDLTLYGYVLFIAYQGWITLSEPINQID